MRICAIATRSLGHIDFGGGGFLRVAGALERLGHEVEWLSYGRTAERLAALGCVVHRAPELEASRKLGRGAEPLRALPALADACRALAARLRDRRPRVLLVDRLNTLCSLVAGALELPYVAMGTPGGYWSATPGGVERVSSPPPVFAELAAALRDRLGWNRGRLDSAWLRSELLNVVFLGRSFYASPCGAGAPDPVAFVDLFEEAPRPEAAAGGSLGIVLGNSGDLARMRLALASLIETGLLAAGEPIDLLAGGRDAGPELDALRALLPEGRVRVHGWVDYARAFSRMQRVVAFAGIGAIWQAVNQRLPMLLVDGRSGDQRANGEAVARLGLGAFLASDGDWQGRPCLGPDAGGRPRHAAALDAFRAASNYSDTLASVAERIARL